MKNIFWGFFIMVLFLGFEIKAQSSNPLSAYPAVSDILDADLLLIQTDSSGYKVWRKLTGAVLKSALAAAAAKDTLSAAWGMKDTVTTGDVGGWEVPYDIVIVKVSGYTDENTVTFNIEERGNTTPNSAGTDVMTSDLVADANHEEVTGAGLSNATIAKNSYLVPTISSCGDAALFMITIKYVKVY